MAKKKEMKKLQKEIRESAHKIWLAGLGALSMASEGGSRLFNELVEKGEGFETRGKKRVDETMDEVEDRAKKARMRVEAAVDDLWEKLDERLGEAMHRFDIPTRDEIQALTRRVEELNKKVDQVRSAPAEVRNVYHVAAHEDGWKVEAEGAARATSLHGTKEEAVAAAKELAQGRAPSQVVIHKKDGSFQTELTYEAH